MEFKDLGLMPELERAVREAGYVRPTPIQAATIPAALAGRDIIGCAQTGTGKTAAFCLPALSRAHDAATDDAFLHTLILTPTRELAAQIEQSLATYGKHLDVWHTVIFGGVSEKPQIEEIRRGIDILVATPGRLLDLMQRGVVKLDRVELFVLDEADRMLDMGFVHDVKRIAKALPKRRQTLFFSATMPDPIRELASTLVQDPELVAVDPVASTVDVVTQQVYFTDKDQKRNLLLHLLDDAEFQRVVVFTRTKHGSDRVARHLERAGKRVAAIHGNKAQNHRTRALAGFRGGQIQVLVATDIAARGIDVDDVTHVINFELPNVPETYVHRIGRTGRAGKGGAAISLCDAEERPYLRDIERLMNKRVAIIEGHPFQATTRAANDALPRARGSHRQAPAVAGARRPNGAGSGRAPEQRRNNAGRPFGRRQDEREDRAARAR